MKYLIVLLALCCSSFAHTQEELENLMDKIAQETCEYLNEDELKGLKGSALEMKLGIYLLKKYNENKEKFQSLGYKWEITDYNAGRDFGTKIGLAMADYCPETLIGLAESSGQLEEIVEEEEGDSDDQELLKMPPPPPPPPAFGNTDALKVEGSLVSITNGPVSYFTLADNRGVEHTLVIVNQFTGKELLNESNKDKRLRAYYVESYFYSLNSGYIKQKELKYLEEVN